MLKKMSLLVASLLVTGTVFTSGGIVYADENEVNNIVENYLETRDTRQSNNEKVKMSGQTTYDLLFENADSELIEFLEKRDELFLNRATEYGYSYEILNRDIITNKVEEDGQLLKANVSVREELLYTIDGVKSVDPSYIETDYTFTFKEDAKNKLSIVDFTSNDIEEMTLKNSDMDFVLEQDKLRIKQEKEELQNTSKVTYDIAPSSINGSFNRSAMYNYAKKHYNNPNPNWGNFTNLGGDCTNFISQILYAGGAPMDRTGSYTWYYDGMSNRAPSWTSVSHLYTYLINNNYTGPQGRLANSSEILYSMNTGDIVQIDFDYDGLYDHTVVITSYQSGASSQTKVAARSYPAFDKALNSYGGSKKYIKLTGYYK